jgi:hypothetical protein
MQVLMYVFVDGTSEGSCAVRGEGVVQPPNRRRAAPTYPLRKENGASSDAGLATFEQRQHHGVAWVVWVSVLTAHVPATWGTDAA